MPDSALHRLRLHGTVVEEANGPVTIQGVQIFNVDSAVRRGTPFQGHSEVRLEGSWSEQPSVGIADVYVIRTSQPLGVLAMALLEPQADDGLATWNFFDKAIDDTMKLAAGRRGYVVMRTTKPIAFPTRIIQ